MEDTICALATTPGISSIAIIRVSGQEAVQKVNKITSIDLISKASHTLNYGFICDGSKKIDEVMISIMLAPKSYTMEDVVEINCHGGIIATKEILQLLLKAGVRLADPGEFTKRAFLNGRIDLLQAEAVQDLITAKSNLSRQVAMNTLDKKVSHEIANIRDQLLTLIANIEVNIDYPEYIDNEQVTQADIQQKLTNCQQKLKEVVRNSEQNQFIKEGLRVAIVGLPNVGKSSLLNALVGQEKAIVTDIAGTTRDLIEEQILLSGIPLNIIDTAGIRKTANIVEQIGVNKSFEQLDKADLIILLLDNSREVEQEELDLIQTLEKDNKKHIIFINKNDLNSKLVLKHDHLVVGNTKSKDGLENLKREIINLFSLNDLANKDYNFLTSIRAIDLAKKAIKNITNALKANENEATIDMLAIDIKLAIEDLGEIIGETYRDDLLTKMFTNFCLGK